jgi:predicted Zn finger-like uncharacterized protein
MIIFCPCGARLKVGDEKLTAAGVKIKCPKCATVHIAKKEATTTERPAPPPQPSMPWFAPSSPAVPQQGALVLIAHDSSVVAEMIATTLQSAGMDTEYAPNGLEALKKATELRPHAMVVDVGLTGIYGFELCERLKSDTGTKHIKIVLLSSVYGLTAYKRSPVTLYGADDYIEKHHIPDQLVPKLKKLLFGEPAPEPPPEPAVAEPTPAPSAPLVSRKGMLQQAPSIATAPPTSAPAPAPAEVRTSEPAPIAPVARPAAVGPQEGFEIPEVPSILPKTPVTLGNEAMPRKAAPAATAQPHQRKEPAPAPVTASSAAPAPSGPSAAASFADGSVKLDADFFEHEEYKAPAKQVAIAAPVDPAEIEKARRFARIIVSDIALYNQETVIEGIRKGTLFDLLKDDVAEGRALYESRVPPAIRSTKDYLQEAFDNFIASKKKLR